MFFSKRTRIVFSNTALAFLFFGLLLLEKKWQYPYAFSLTLLSYACTYWSFKQYLYGIKLVNLFVLPVFLVIFTAIFLIQSDLTLWLRIVVIGVFALSNYIITLSENIFNISQVRNIPLLRAARTVGYLSTLGVGYLGYFVIFNSHLNLVSDALLILVFSFLIYLQAFWQIELREQLSEDVFISSVGAALMTGQIGLVTGFFPLSSIGSGLALTTVTYTLLGLLVHKIKGDIPKRALYEYIIVGLCVYSVLIAVLK